MKNFAGPLNVPIALASLALSLAFWWIALPGWMTTRDRRFTVKLEYDDGAVERKALHAVKPPATINFYARVSEQDYDNYSKSATAEANLVGAQSGTKYYAVDLYPPALRQLVDPKYLLASFTFEPLVHRTIDVEAESSGKFSDPTEILNKMDVDTKTVDAEGPADDVAKVVHARATLRLDKVPGINPEPVSVTLEPVDGSDRVLSGVTLHPGQITVTPRFSIAPQQKRVFVETDFGAGKVAQGYTVKSYTVIPSYVTVTGSSEALSKIASVSTESIDLSNVSQTQTLKIGIKRLGEGVKVSPEAVSVTVVVQPVNLNRLDPTPAAPPSSAGGTGTGR